MLLRQDSLSRPGKAIIRQLLRLIQEPEVALKHKKAGPCVPFLIHKALLLLAVLFRYGILYRISSRHIIFGCFVGELQVAPGRKIILQFFDSSDMECAAAQIDRGSYSTDREFRLYNPAGSGRPCSADHPYRLDSLLSPADQCNMAGEG